MQLQLKQEILSPTNWFPIITKFKFEHDGEVSWLFFTKLNFYHVCLFTVSYYIIISFLYIIKKICVGLTTHVLCPPQLLSEAAFIKLVMVVCLSLHQEDSNRKKWSKWIPQSSEVLQFQTASPTGSCHLDPKDWQEF